MKPEAEMEKVNLSENSVAYFDDSRVSTPGFYTLAGTRETSSVAVRSAEWMTEGDKLAVDERGNLVPLSIQKEDEIEVEHESNLAPDKQVWPSPDGDGFLWERPNANVAEGDYVREVN